MDELPSRSTASESTERFRLLYELACSFAARIDPEDLFPTIVAKCRELFDAEAASVLLLDADRTELYFPFVAEEDPEVLDRVSKLRFPSGRGIAGAVLRSGRAASVEDARTDPRFFAEIDRASGFTTRNLICAPLTLLQGAIGVLQVLNRRGGAAFTEEDLAFLEALAGIVAIAIENARLYARVKESEERLRAEVVALRRDRARRDRFEEIVGGAAMDEVFGLMESAAASPIAVLIEGETGTGKELVARAIHRTSGRADGPFVAVNCAALSETLLESELFGHRRGAFTGAMQDHRGLFEAAGGGTIFLDEIGEMSLAMQAKLLRVLQEGEVVPVGDTRPRKVDVRVISATNRDLSTDLGRQGFRPDLYYRLAAFPIRLPPLRERREDIPLLVDHLLRQAAERHGKEIAGIDARALDLLCRFAWPGNVRELQNEIERAVALAPAGAPIGVEVLSPRLASLRTVPSAGETVAPAAPMPPPPESPTTTTPLRQARAEFEARYVERVLAENARNVSRTARVLGISRVMLQKKMKDYGLR